MTDFNNVRRELESALSPKRYRHVLSVVKEVEALADIFAVNNKDELISAALLHDCTKPLDFEAQKELAKSLSVPLSSDDLKSPEVLHAKTGAAKALKDYGVSRETSEMIFCHCTGKKNMRLEEKLLFLADFIEETRTYDTCLKIRKIFYKEISSAENYGKKLYILDKTLIDVIKATLEHLNEKNVFVHPETVDALDSLEKSLQNPTSYKKED